MDPQPAPSLMSLVASNQDLADLSAAIVAQVDRLTRVLQVQAASIVTISRRLDAIESQARVIGVGREATLGTPAQSRNLADPIRDQKG